MVDGIRRQLFQIIWPFPCVLHDCNSLLSIDCLEVFHYTQTHSDSHYATVSLSPPLNKIDHYLYLNLTQGNVWLFLSAIIPLFSVGKLVGKFIQDAGQKIDNNSCYTMKRILLRQIDSYYQNLIIMLNQILYQSLITLLLLSEDFLCNKFNDTSTDVNLRSTTTIDIKIGFIVGSRRTKNDRAYSQPGWQLVHAFNYGIDKINSPHYQTLLQREREEGIQNNSNNNNETTIRFVPIVVETFGKESESIKQTISLITKHRVNFIVGPQETCQVESKLASVFNVPMISHYCSAYQTPLTQQQTLPTLTTFIQTKPPHWKIVKRVTTLLKQLLYVNNNNWYPQQLVLLYFKEPPPPPINGRQSPIVGGQQGDKRATTTTTNSGQSWPTPTNSSKFSHHGRSEQTMTNRWQDAYLANDAIQYKLIGELLEIELNQLFSPSSSSSPSSSVTNQATGGRKLGKMAPLTVLNWHTTFHYGFTPKNPFRQLIGRHLFRQHLLQHGSYATAATNQSDSGQYQLCQDSSSSPLMNPLRSIPMESYTNRQPFDKSRSKLVANQQQKSAIYVIVGHYYEHLGLMLALNELKLLGSQQQQQQEPTQQFAAERQSQSSVLANNQQESLVIGVDIEQYDEREDSVHFLQGPLASGQHGRGASVDSVDLDSIAMMYRHYMGVVPAKPTRMAEFLEDMILHYNQTSALLQQQTIHQADGHERLPLTASASAAAATVNQTTLDSIQLTTKLLPFMRLPVEASYLYDSLTLVGSYFYDCLRQQRNLSQCSEGNRAFDWFRNREYFSFVDHNRTRFDSQAQTNGHYSLITARKMILNNNNNNNEVIDDGDLGLVPVGRFVDDSLEGEHKIEFYVEADNVDPIWLPLWCHVRQSNLSECRASINKTNNQPFEDLSEDASTKVQQFGWLIKFGLFLTPILALLCYMISGDFYLKFGQKSANTQQVGWFDEKDEQNFLEIVHKFLLTPEILHQTNELNDDQTNMNEMSNHQEQENSTMMIELHCHMFPFPSCKFVHWLTALFQLKEMMFQYHSSLSGDMINHQQKNYNNKDKSWTDAIISRIQHSSPDYDGGFAYWLRKTTKTPSNLNSTFTTTATTSTNHSNKGFFRLKHKGTASLRILLNKYKSINECFCNLSNLDNETIVKLYGASLSASHIAPTTTAFNSVNSSARGGKIVHLMVEQPDRGSLREALSNLFQIMDSEALETLELRELIVLSFINDLLLGIEFLHKSKVEFHGELKASNCLITNDWQLKMSGFHEFHMRRSLGEYEIKKNSNDDDSLELYYNNLIYSAPEILMNHNRRHSLSKETLKLADFYSLAFIIYELIVDQEPWNCLTQVKSGKLLVERVQADSSFRPPLSLLESKQSVRENSSSKRMDLAALQRLIRSCWSQSSERRPQSISILRDRLMVAIRYQPKKGQVMKMYSQLLEKVTLMRKRCFELELQRSTELRLRSLPESIVRKINLNQQIPVQKFNCVSLCLFRIVLAQDEPNPLEQLNEILTQLDSLIGTYRKRIHLLDSQVDSSLRHLVFSGEPLVPINAHSTSQQPTPTGDIVNQQSLKRGPNSSAFSHCQLVASFALQLIDLANKWQSKFNSSIQVRCGLHCGPVLGGLIVGAGGGSTNSQSSNQTNQSIGEGCRQQTSTTLAAASCFNSTARYVLYGNTLQMADLLESSCVQQRIQVSGEFRSQILQNFSSKMPLNGGKQRYSATAAALDEHGDDIGSIRQGYVMIKREAKISSKVFGEFEAYWLLNGPRLTASQSIMLLSD